MGNGRGRVGQRAVVRRAAVDQTGQEEVEVDEEVNVAKIVNGRAEFFAAAAVVAAD